MSKQIPTVDGIERIEPVDLDGQLGFEIELLTTPRRGASSVTLKIGTPVLVELLTELAYKGTQVGRDYHYELWGAISQGEDRARRETGR